MYLRCADLSDLQMYHVICAISSNPSVEMWEWPDAMLAIEPNFDESMAEGRLYPHECCEYFGLATGRTAFSVFKHYTEMFDGRELSYVEFIEHFNPTYTEHLVK